MRKLFITIMLCLGPFLWAQPNQSVFNKPPTNSSRVSGQAFGISNVSTVKRNCYTVQMESKLQEKYPDRATREEFEAALKQAIDRRNTLRTSATDQVYRIPTIIHVIHNGEEKGSGANISSAQVMSQFDVLNEDFRRLGAGFNEDPNGADIFVEFVPASLDESGNALSDAGIDRVDGGKDFWDESSIENDLKPTTIWDPEKYFNIWVVNFGGDLDGVLGYAQFPSMSGLTGLADDMGEAATDGVVIGYQFFGRTGNVQNPYDLGRTATHEVGHWLGLIHIWGDGDCSVDDYCADTPNADGPNYGCSEHDGCTDDDLPDMIENYMDYTDDACMNIFTQDQKTRIRTVLEISPRRMSLIGPQCDEATEVTAGANTSTMPVWHTYTATANGVVTISSVGKTTENTLLSIYPDCGKPAINISDDALGSEQSELSTLVKSGDELKIFWSAKYSEAEFDWEITTSDAVDGAVCDLAQTAVQGDNTIGNSELHTYWYSFTMPDEFSKILINSGDKHTDIYRGDCMQLKKIRTGEGKINIADIAKGEQIFIAFEISGGDFTWTLNVEALQQGEGCSVAVAAAEGTNTAPSTPYWYTFTMPENGNLTISSVGLSEVATSLQVFDECGGKLLGESNGEGANNQSEIMIKSLYEGEEVLIFWSDDYSSDPFDWEISVDPVVAGEVCELPAQAILGTNTVPASEAELFWYSFTMPSSDKKYEISSTSGEYVYVTDNCNNLTQLATGFESAVVTGYSEGEQIMFVWELTDGGGFDWTLTETDPVQGDVCSNPKSADIGTNTVDYAPSWFTYTMTSDGSLVISSVGLTDEDTHLIIYDQCDGEVLVNNDDYGDGFQSKGLVSDLMTGDEVLIYWAPSWSSTGFDWSLEVLTDVSGMSCENPKKAELGTNSVPALPIDFYWSTFTVPESDKKLVITSEADEFVYLVTDCDNQDLYAYGHNGMSYLGLEAGQEVLIVWELYNGIGFDYELSMEDPTPGDGCQMPITPELGSNHADYAPLWYQYTMPRDGGLKISSAGQTEEDTYLMILSDCEGEPIQENDDFGDGVQSEITLENLSKGEEVIILWADAYSNVAFDWTLSLVGVTNSVPSMSDQTFTIITSEVTNGAELGTLEVSDPDGDELLFTLTGGNDNGAFLLEESTGVLSIADATLWDLQDLDLTVEVSDGIETVSATVSLRSIILSSPNLAEIMIYPNPTKDRLSIGMPETMHVRSGKLTDLSGKSVIKFKNEKSLSVRHLDEGVYLLILDLEDGSRLNKKVIIQK